MTLTYADAVARLGSRAERKGERNTYLHRIDAVTIGVRLHQTDVVLIHANGSYTLNSGGWLTVTTMDRVGKYSPARPYRINGVWCVGDVTYTDGMVVDGTGGVLSGGLPNQTARKRRLDRMVLKYIKGFCAWVAAARNLDMPGNGDCWGCLMASETADPNDPFGGLEPMGLDHLFGHFEEKYYVPSLLWKACQALRYGDPAYVYRMMQADARNGRTDTLRRTLAGYFRKRKPALLDLLRVQEESTAA